MALSGILHILLQLLGQELRVPDQDSVSFSPSPLTLFALVLGSPRHSLRGVEQTSESPSGFQVERDEIRVPRTAARMCGRHCPPRCHPLLNLAPPPLDWRLDSSLGGWDPRAGPESPLCDQAGSGRLGLRISEWLSDIFKERVWWVGKRRTGEAEGRLGHEEVEASSKG